MLYFPHSAVSRSPIAAGKHPPRRAVPTPAPALSNAPASSQSRPPGSRQQVATPRARASNARPARAGPDRVGPSDTTLPVCPRGWALTGVCLEVLVRSGRRPSAPPGASPACARFISYARAHGSRGPVSRNFNRRCDEKVFSRRFRTPQCVKTSTARICRSSPFVAVWLVDGDKLVSLVSGWGQTCRTRTDGQ